MAEFKIDRLRFRWKGPWQAETEYLKDELVEYDGKTYVCIVAHVGHTSGDFYEDLNAIDQFNRPNPYWELMFDGTEWTGDWQVSTIYNLGNIVKYRSNIYRCIEPHTSALLVIQGLEKDDTKWEILFTAEDWDNVWRPLANYKINQIVRYNGIIYRCIDDHIASTNVNGLEQDQLKWEIVAAADDWRGDWATSYRYVKNDIVKYGGITYRCLIGHTSAATFELGLEDAQTNPTAPKWEIVASGIEYKFDWIGEVTEVGNESPGVRYKLNDVVKYGSTLWICKNPHTSSETFITTDWNKWIPGISYENEWDPSTPYAAGDVVTYGGYSYVALQNNTGTIPSSYGKEQDVGDWELVTTGYRFVGNFITGDAYLTGDVVRASGYVYLALVDTTAHPNTSADWELLVPGILYRGEWQPSTIYNLGDVLTDQSTSYICKKRHNGTEFETRPSLDTHPQNGANEYWDIYVPGTETNVMRYRGDIRTYGLTDDGSTVATKRLAINEPGNVLKVADDSELFWQKFDYVPKVYYVSPDGIDADHRGDTLANPFRTIRYACNFILADEAARAPATIFVKTGFYEEQLPIVVPANVAIVGDELRSANVSPAPTYETSDMFRVRNGSGIRNMTLTGLKGQLGSPNQYLTRRPTAGAYVALDPGAGPNSQASWITTKSPYVQNVTAFGEACIGLRVQGELHNGGNKSVVANDFTQVLSDGIGFWVSGEGKAELVSVFTYYNHIGYLATNGGKVRATNGNNSYGTYGSVAEGFNVLEDPITARVDNRTNEALISDVYTNAEQIIGVAYSSVGQDYTTATVSIKGSGVGASAAIDDFRYQSVSEARIFEPSDSSGAGGANYTFLQNNAQGGDAISISISSSDDESTESVLVGQRITIIEGKGVGQYGEITSFDFASKRATVSRLTDDQPGWDHITPGWPIETVLDETTKYVIEPNPVFTRPPFFIQYQDMPANLNWKDSAYGDNGWVAIAENSNIGGISEDGVEWSQISMPTIASPNWRKIVYGNGRYVAIAYNSNQGGYSLDGETWVTMNMPVSSTWLDLIWTGTKFVAINESGDIAESTDGQSWSSIAGISGLLTLPSDVARSIAYGNGIYVIASQKQLAYSTDLQIWTGSANVDQFIELEYGNGRFVAMKSGPAAGVNVDQTLYSFDGATWYNGTLPEIANWAKMSYGHGVFVAIARNGTEYAESADGKIWTRLADDSSIKTITSGSYESLNSGLINGQPYWFAIEIGSTNVALIDTGARAVGRTKIISGRISAINLFEPGSGYNSPPSVTIYDSINTSDAVVLPRIQSRSVAPPVFSNRGIGYRNATATITGDGFADIFQTGRYLWVYDLSRLPGPGDNLNVVGIDDVTYKVISVVESSGSEPNISAKLNISPTIDINESPAHGVTVTIRQQYSQVRLTGHDFLDIGLGNKEDTRYPDVYKDYLNYEISPFNETVQAGGGRVFYTSTDQDGNFRVGELFEVEQATGTITISADYFDLSGLTELRLGGVVLGGTGAVIREFSTDPTMAANSNNIVPTQRAIAAYLAGRVAGGGADARANALVAGQVAISGQQIGSTLGNQINIPVSVNIRDQRGGAGISGDYVAMSYFNFAAASFNAASRSSGYTGGEGA